MAYTRQLCACASVWRWFLHLHPHAQATSTTDFSLEGNMGRHWSSNSNKSLTFQSMIMHCPYAQSDKLKQRVLFVLDLDPQEKNSLPKAQGYGLVKTLQISAHEMLAAKVGKSSRLHVDPAGSLQRHGRHLRGTPNDGDMQMLTDRCDKNGAFGSRSPNGSYSRRPTLAAAVVHLLQTESL